MHRQNRPTNPRAGESGQVLLTGIVMLVILLLAILLLFDIHSVIRAKYKVETASQAAALAGAEWQKESLNLIGEINLIKACETMLESEDYWPETIRPVNPLLTPEEQRDQMLTERIGLLTEMQSRVAFLGPLVGFAAAQQTAKRNGMTPRRNFDLSMPLQGYVDRLNLDWRYRQVPVVRNFRWRAPYTQMVSDIIDQGIVVYPNARVAGNPIVDPPGLDRESLYSEIMLHRSEIAIGDPPAQSTWKGVIYDFVKKSDAYYQGKWWNIDYSMSTFPSESEIFTIGVEYGSTGYNESARTIIQQMLKEKTAYEVDSLPPVQFCIYDKFWYPEHYRNTYSDYDENHYSWWFEAGVLRKSIKPQYRYEGPAAYAESAADINLVGRYAVTRRKGAEVDQRFVRRSDPDNKGYSRRIGSRRVGSYDSDLMSSDYRPGAIAKPLGELAGDSPPIALPIILPVFDSTSLMPTYMPIPYGFSILRTGNSMLERFLSWLSRQSSLFDYEDDPPRGTEWYLTALQTLTDGAGFRYYGWNPSWDADAFDRRYADDASVLFTKRDYVYSQSNASGAGWLQEAQVFTVSSTAEIDIKEVVDHINGGIAHRWFKGDRSRQYIVVDSSNHIITNDELDPTIYYYTGGGYPGGNGPGFNGTQNTPDTQPGPPRI